MSACPGRCNPRGGGVVLGEPVWCVSCGEVVRVALRSLPGVYVALGGVSSFRGSPTDVVRVSGSRERCSPSVAVDLRDELFQWVRLWEDCLRRLLRDGAAHDGVSRLATLRGGVGYLSRNFDRMMGRSECAADFGREANVLFSTALRLVKDGPLRVLLSCPCPFCDRKTLMQQEGVALRPWYTACESTLGGCGRLFTETEMVWMTNVRLAVKR